MMSRSVTLPFVVTLLTACAEDAGRPAARAEETDPHEHEDAKAPIGGASMDAAQSSEQSLDDAGSMPLPSDPDAGPPMIAPGVLCDELVCDVFAACEGGEQPHCKCATGLEGDGQRCADVDECQQNGEACGANATCENTFGAYACNCKPGYILKDDECVADSACEASPCAEGAYCTDEEGQPSCTCDVSTFGNGYFCAQEDACAELPCGENGQCIAVAGTERSLVCACSLGFAGDSSCTACGDELALTDPALERAVRQQLGIATDDLRAIQVHELSTHSTLNAAKFGVTSLAGLECWPTLRVLDLSYNEGLTIDGAEALAALNGLSDLRLDCTQVTDLRIIAGHPNLRALSANVLNCDNPILLEDSSALSSMPQLEVLDLRGQKLRDGAALSGLRNLHSLWFGYNELSSVDDLPDMPLLRELDVSFNQLTELDGLARYSRLRYLNVSNNEISSLQVTESLFALKTLNASHNGLAALPDWHQLEELRQIDFSYNQVASVEAIAGLGQVTWVNAAGNAIATLVPLLTGALRGTLVVAGNPLECDDQGSVIAGLRSSGVDVQGECTPPP